MFQCVDRIKKRVRQAEVSQFDEEVCLAIEAWWARISTKGKKKL